MIIKYIKFSRVKNLPTKMLPTPNVPVPTVIIPQQYRMGGQPIQGTTPVFPPQNKPATAPFPGPTMGKGDMQVPQATIGNVPQAKPQMTSPVTRQGGMLRQFGGGTGVATIITGPQIIAAPTVTIVTETGNSLLSKLMKRWNGTPEQVDQLCQLRYTNGSLIIDINRKDIIKEVVGMLINQQYQDVISFLSDVADPDFLLWKQKSLDEGRTMVEREIVILTAEEAGVKGVARCRYCPSTELVYAMRQLRASDEPATIFVRCVMCNRQWKE